MEGDSGSCWRRLSPFLTRQGCDRRTVSTVEGNLRKLPSPLAGVLGAESCAVAAASSTGSMGKSSESSKLSSMNVLLPTSKSFGDNGGEPIIAALVSCRYQALMCCTIRLTSHCCSATAWFVKPAVTRRCTCTPCVATVAEVELVTIDKFVKQDVIKDRIIFFVSIRRRPD